MFSKLKLMIRLKLWCHVWFFYPKAPNVRLQRIFPEQLLMFFSLGSHKSTRFHHLKKTKPLNIWRIHHPDDLSVYPSTELVDPEKKPEWYRNRFSRRPEETRRVLWLLSSLRSRLWKRRECHFSGRFKCSDIFLCLSDRWLFLALYMFFFSCPGQRVYTSYSIHPTLGGTAPHEMNSYSLFSKMH